MNLYLLWLFIHSFIHHACIGPLGTMVDIAYKTHPQMVLWNLYGRDRHQNYKELYNNNFDKCCEEKYTAFC